MTYLQNGQEFMTMDELDVWRAVQDVVLAGRTANTSMVAVRARLPRTSVAKILEHLHGRGFVKDVGAGNAHHWRLTGKVPANGTEERDAYQGR